MFDNRCGCCWKCCVENLYLMDIDKLEYNEAYYLHCFSILACTIHKETGFVESDIRAVWENYMFYPIEHSKAYDLLSDAELRYLPNGSMWIYSKGVKYT